MTGNSVIQLSENDTLSIRGVSQRETSRFIAKEWDEETKLYYMSARYQNPMTSWWMSADPAGFGLVNPNREGFSLVESLNWYSYTGNNPLNFIDPTGGYLLNAQRSFNDFFMQDSGSNIGTSDTAVDQSGCFVTAYAREGNTWNAYRLESSGKKILKMHLYGKITLQLLVMIQVIFLLKKVKQIKYSLQQEISFSKLICRKLQTLQSFLQQME